jgi:hypothetical protein
MPTEPTEPPAELKPEPKITFTTALLCQYALKDYKNDLLSAVNIIDTITLEHQPEWVEFVAVLIATSDQTEPFFAKIQLSIKFPSGKVDILKVPERLDFGSELSVQIKRNAGAKLIIGLRLLFSESGNYTFTFSTRGSVAEIPFTVNPRAN